MAAVAVCAWGQLDREGETLRTSHLGRCGGFGHHVEGDVVVGGNSSCVHSLKILTFIVF